VRLRTWARRFVRCDSGTSILEAAVVIPIMVVLMGGIYDFGRAYGAMSAGQKSMRAAVRFLTRLPAETVCKSWALDQAKNIALYGNTAGTGSLLVPNWTTGDITLTTKPNNCPTTSVTNINMSASVPYSSLMWSAIGFGDTTTMRVEHEEKWVGQ